MKVEINLIVLYCIVLYWVSVPEPPTAGSSGLASRSWGEFWVSAGRCRTSAISKIKLCINQHYYSNYRNTSDGGAGILELLV